MLALLSDTHASDPPTLSDALRAAIESATLVLHAGDFVALPVLEGFEELAPRFVAVHGNVDARAVTDRLPATETVEQFDRRFLLVHGDGHDETSLSLLARQERADVVVTGHTHRPTLAELGESVLVNPGSHADPRGNRPGYATVERTDAGVVASLRSLDGETVEQKPL